LFVCSVFFLVVFFSLINEIDKIFVMFDAKQHAEAVLFLFLFF
jgi:hypothetical protein